MRFFIAALALTSTLMLLAPGALALSVPDPNNLPAVNPAPVNQCLGSSVIVHLCAVATLNLPQRTDPVPATVGTPTAGCTPGTPGAVGNVIACDASVAINGRTTTVHLHLLEGRTLP
jgi:hypothetical protein